MLWKTVFSEKYLSLKIVNCCLLFKMMKIVTTCIYKNIDMSNGLLYFSALIQLTFSEKYNFYANLQVKLLMLQ